jgi:ribosome-associated protein
MSHPERQERRRTQAAADVPASAEGTVPDSTPLSKTRRKAEMHALQSLGDALILLDPKRFDELARDVALPEELVDAIRQARSITAWGGRKRQHQYVGKLMREVDPEPIRRQLESWALGHDIDTARQHALEQRRDRLVAEPRELDLLSAEYPTLDRPRFRALIAKAREERERGAPPHAYRELFRALKALDSKS